MLSDGRFPAGGYAHSGGLEPTVAAGRVSNAAELEQFLVGRAETAGFVAAVFAAAACSMASRGETVALAGLEAELDARFPSSELRAVSRTLGRQLLRAMSTIHPHPYFSVLAAAPHQPMVMGIAAAAFGLDSRAAALAILHESVAGPAAAAAKLMPVDPFEVHAALARASARLDRLSEAAAAQAEAPVCDFPSLGSPLMDIAAEHHKRRSTRLFAS
ncbi:urease accessory UreF family protein [Hoeflea sp. YIM 152468]|uniref:urease accessory protein UreF n=1 Tax=Hoeflea sp. YIM 152468 TaxID=3031759 RepID=UPI0023DAF234|nr:urease accessory UreF family protein [Hoeflea sp. YIM 152468]